MATDGGRRGGGGRGLLIALVVLALIGVATYALGLWNVDTSGQRKAPAVAVDIDTKGGEVPEMQVETADIDVGTKTETVKVPEIDIKTDETEVKLPTIDVQQAGDAASTNK